MISDSMMLSNSITKINDFTVRANYNRKNVMERHTKIIKKTKYYINLFLILFYLIRFRFIKSCFMIQ